MCESCGEVHCVVVDVFTRNRASVVTVVQIDDLLYISFI